MQGFTLDAYCCKIYPDSDSDSLVTYCVAKSRFVFLGSDLFFVIFKFQLYAAQIFRGFGFPCWIGIGASFMILLSSLSSNLFYPITEDHDSHAISHDVVKL